MPIAVTIADDHAVVRTGIRAIIEKSGNFIQVVAEAENGQKILELAQKYRTDIYILDISMPVLNGIETAQRLKKFNPQCKVIILSMHGDRSLFEKALKVGVNGYLLKESAIDEVVRAVHEVHKGGSYFSPKISMVLAQGYTQAYFGESRPKKQNKMLELTSKEIEILQLLAEGFSSKEIGIQLGSSFNTVMVHKKNIMKKLDLHTAVDLTRFALKEGIAML